MPMITDRSDRPRIAVAGMVLAGISSVFFALASECAYGSQLTKGDRLVLQQKMEVRNYERPRRSGNRVAFCLRDVGECGKPAADAFCRDNDFEGALTFQRDRMEGHSARMRFLRIKCWRSSSSTASAAAKQVLIPEATGGNVRSNTSAKSNRRR